MAQADRSHFEQEWENAFANARMKPSPKVWDGIERSLHGGFGTRKRLFLIQLAMAASVLFAMSIGAAGVYQQFFAGDKEETAMVTQEDVLNGEGGAEAKTGDVGKEAMQGDGGAEANIPAGIQQSDAGDRSETLADNGLISADRKNEGIENRNESAARNANLSGQSAIARTVPSLVEGSVNSSFSADLEPLDPFSGSLAYHAALPVVTPQGVPNVLITYPRENGSSGGWASVGFSAGSFNAGSSPQNSYVLGASMDNSLSVGRVSEESNGSVFQVEMNFGKRFAEKWFIQGGLGYMERNSEGLSNMISAQGRSVSFFNSEQSAVVVSEPYKLENSMQMITMPVQVGYVVLDKKVGLKVLTGVANELMIKYQMQDAEGQLGSQSVRASESDDYNSYGMSALVTTEVSYALADRYEVAVYPQMRKSLMPLKETDTELPLSMELGFRLRYMIE